MVCEGLHQSVSANQVFFFQIRCQCFPWHMPALQQVMSYVSKQEGSSHYRITASLSRKGASSSASAASKLIQEFSLQHPYQVAIKSQPVYSSRPGLSKTSRKAIMLSIASIGGKVFVILNQNIPLYNFDCFPSSNSENSVLPSTSLPSQS